MQSKLVLFLSLTIFLLGINLTNVSAEEGDELPFLTKITFADKELNLESSQFTLFNLSSLLNNAQETVINFTALFNTGVSKSYPVKFIYKPQTADTGSKDCHVYSPPAPLITTVNSLPQDKVVSVSTTQVQSYGSVQFTPAGQSTTTPTMVIVRYQQLLPTDSRFEGSCLPDQNTVFGSQIFELKTIFQNGGPTPVMQQLTVKYTDEDLSLTDANLISLQTYDIQNKRWQKLNTAVDTNNQTINANLSGLALQQDTKGGIFALTLQFETPILDTPQEGQVLQLTNLNLKWTQAPQTKQYQIQVVPFNNDGPGLNLIVGQAPEVQSSGYTIQPPVMGSGQYIMLPGMTYTWRIRTSPVSPLKTPLGENDLGWSDWTPFKSFRSVPPTSVTMSLIAPISEAQVDSLTPKLQWTNQNKNIFYYEVQLSKDQNFVTDPDKATAAVSWEIIHGGETTPLNSYQVKEQYKLEPSTTYYWRVRPRVQGDGNPVDWSDTWSFKTP